MTHTILFFSDELTPRLRYTIESIVGNLLGLTFVFTQNEDLFRASDLPKINYSHTSLSINALFISPHNLLFDNTITPYFIETDADFFMPKNAVVGADFDFDVFARIFFLVSRYEEYHCPPSVFDAHNRFPSVQSVASKLNFLQQPLVNQYVIQLSEKLKKRFPHLLIQLPTYRFQPTFDIDTTWLYLHKGLARHAGGLMKDIFKGKWQETKKRVQILRGALDDPYFTFDYIKKLHQKYNLSPVIFWLLGDLGKYDKSISWTNPAFQQLLQTVAQHFKVGIHPSYRSNDNVLILKEEVGRLEKIVQKGLHSHQNKAFTPYQNTHFKTILNSSEAQQIEKQQNTEGGGFPSRQHFLKLTFPETYRRLLAVGIQEDWTMGYADETGFRASIATPFRWFDVEKNEETPLMIYPFQAMDVTLNKYLRLTPEAATMRLQTLIETTKNVGGTFTTLWHNDNLAEMDNWKGWKTVYERLIKDAL